MDILEKYQFADWLYNRFVEQFRQSNIPNALINKDTLQQYMFFAQRIGKMSDQRRHIKQLFTKITKALKTETADKLLLTGDEGIGEFNHEMKAYEDRLREMGLSEEYILLSVVEKKWQYGN
ncbi:MAG: hypothetical protein LBF27_06145 [Sphingobacterium sp.]|jgi:hypothetical protein|nr:hypothetical protein [Sphingobacterium sp.]